MRVWCNAESNTFMSLNDAQRLCTFSMRAERARTERARQADAHCCSLRARQA